MANGRNSYPRLVERNLPEAQRRIEAVAQLPDDALLAGVAGGDADAARAFVRRYQQRVYGLALGVVGDRMVAEDVAQEVFWRVWRHAASFDSRRGSAATWVLSITRNAALDTVRTRRPVAVDPAALVFVVPDGNSDQPADDAVAGDRNQRLRTALATLPTEQLDAVVRASLGGWTAAEVAEHAGIPLGTAKTRIRTGLRRLRLALTEETAT